jgi:hypothetical protein
MVLIQANKHYTGLRGSLWPYRGLVWPSCPTGKVVQAPAPANGIDAFSSSGLGKIKNKIKVDVFTVFTVQGTYTVFTDFTVWRT